ncbi:MAG TPA: hypothetical protein VG652_11330 [Gaiellaceae bacterium]|nr:hypothetical protein [Gaiellaceae bacterium]
MEPRRKRKLIGIAVAVLAVCGGGAAIAAIALGSGGGNSGAASVPAITTTAAPDTGSGGGLGGNLYGGGGGGGGGRGFGGGGGGFRGGGPGGLTRDLGPAATYLGVTTAALQSDIQSGQTLAQVAKAQGKSVDGLISAMVNAQKSQFDALVKSGRVSAAQAQQFESFIKQRVTDMVNGTRPSFPGGGRGGFGDDGGSDGSGGLGGGSGGGSGTFGGSSPPTGSATA